ncbi:hypothetical protein GCM10029976_090850 [Kribbella albertanoniae]|uniref:Uncharacterized protein n=1 Tax=Kribbella albertanoniae TaxID=1266829 RepID=A0A4V2XPI3_9ACTN|nr:hypothetical protein [Kribbella albertanoniae]TDC22155.1 hypothetical protein E1261_31695 [Kribbella albertanoniae]
MTEAQRRRILTRARSAGYTGADNLGNVFAWANSASAPSRVNPLRAGQRRTMTSIANSLSGSQ